MRKRNGCPIPSPLLEDKGPKAVAAGELGEKKGGKARAKSLSALKRKKIAREAARARWVKKRWPRSGR